MGQEALFFFLAADQWNDAFLLFQTLLMQGMSGNLQEKM